ncbi:YrhK family protein [Vibrio sp. Isolate24]|nr:YrhK family protein [Vibrio sp. Isolate24]MCG9679129.1 YrhK family protein [Vibrio sp. Isolate24]
MKLDLDIDNRHAVIQRRYEALGAINDLLIAIWFLVASLFFLNEPLVESGNWMFVISG